MRQGYQNLELFIIGRLGGGARLVWRPYTEHTELRLTEQVSFWHIWRILVKLVKLVRLVKLGQSHLVEHAELRRVRTELSLAAVKIRT